MDTALIIKQSKSEKLEELQEGKDNEKRAAIYTDSKITLALLQNKFKRNRFDRTY